MASCRAWRERTARVFLKKNSHLTLLDVLCPRTDIGAEGKRNKRRSQVQQQQPKDQDSITIPHPTFQHLTAEQLADPQAFVQTFYKAQREEKEAMKRLRERNRAESDRLRIEGKAGAKIECELCLELFHPSHVPLKQPQQQQNSGAAATGTGENVGSPKQQSQPKKISSLRDIKFLCPSCTLSRRPRLETILSLLVSLQKLNIRLPEGDALQCLTERAMAWQDSARTALGTDEVKTAFDKLQSPAEDESDEEGKKATPPEIDLASSTVASLEALMLEGDLLEVSLDESQHMWRLLQSTEPRRSKEYPELGALEAELESVREEKIRAKKKRRMEENGAGGGGASGSGTEAKKKSAGGGDCKRRKKEVTTKRTKRKADDGGTTTASSTTEDEEEVEEEQDCAANPSCLKPTGKEVSY